MSLEGVPVVGDVHSLSKKLLEFLKNDVKLCRPSTVHICNGSEEENRLLIEKMVAESIIEPLTHYENCWLACTDPRDVARVEKKTFICTPTRREAVPATKNGVDSQLGNWMPPNELQRLVDLRFSGCMKGRTMYVMIYRMGPFGCPLSRVGVQVTDSPYVVVCMRIMTRMGSTVLEYLADGDFVRCLHSVGCPLPLQRPLVNHWPCDPEHTFITHNTATNEIFSYGSGYGGNSLLGKKCFSLRIGSSIARREGWLAEHMLIIGVTKPCGEKRYIAAAFPSQCGKTNMAMMTPSLPGYRVECIGDDIAWMYFDKQGNLRAVNPENGFFGVCPGTNHHTNPIAMETIKKNTIFTNVAKTSSGRVYWEGLEQELQPGDKIRSWLGDDWTPALGSGPAAHSNSRFCVPAGQCPIIDPCWQDAEGVIIDAIIFGGRMPHGIPLVYESFNWQHGVFVAASLSSQCTSAASDYQEGHKIMHDPFSMRPFLSYNAGQYIDHWLSMEQSGRKMPKIFHVNWFGRDSNGKFLWPGFGDNIRVIDWILRRCTTEQENIADTTFVGWIPKAGSLDLSGMSEVIDWGALFSLSKDFWTRHINEIESYFDEQIGDDLPSKMRMEIDLIRKRISE